MSLNRINWKMYLLATKCLPANR